VSDACDTEEGRDRYYRRRRGIHLIPERQACSVPSAAAPTKARPGSARRAGRA
jgi:hypothetical protein